MVFRGIMAVAGILIAGLMSAAAAADDLGDARIRADAGDAQAQRILGMAYLGGKTVARDDGLAVHWLTLAADQNDSRAQGILAALYQKGEDGVGKNPVLALSWLNRAAENGDPPSLHNLAALHFVGQDVPKDVPRAVTLFSRAAELNFAPSQFMLGWMYSEGRVVPQDKARGLDWLRRAAAQGEPRAIAALNSIKEKSPPPSAPAPAPALAAAPVPKPKYDEAKIREMLANIPVVRVIHDSTPRPHAAEVGQ